MESEDSAAGKPHLGLNGHFDHRQLPIPLRGCGFGPTLQAARTVRPDAQACDCPSLAGRPRTPQAPRTGPNAPFR